MKDFVAGFEAEVYEPLTKVWITDVDRYIADHLNQVRREFHDVVKKQLSMAAQYITQDKPAAYLSFSVFYASVYFGRPQLRLDFYDEGWLFGKTLYAAYIDLPWLFALWESHRRILAQAAKEYSSRVTPRHIQQMLWRSVRFLILLAAERMKYWSVDIAGAEAFQNLPKAQAFYITFGEYQDWQKTVYARLPNVDIFNCELNESLQNRDFTRCAYRDKAFSGLNLSGSRFYRCTFENTAFFDAVLNDVRFEDCIFKQVEFSEVHMLGLTAKNTVFTDVLFSKTACGTGQVLFRTGELYKKTEFQDCCLKNVQIKESCFNQALLSDCVVEHLQLLSGDFENSDFAEYLEANAKRAGDL